MVCRKRIAVLILAGTLVLGAAAGCSTTKTGLQGGTSSSTQEENGKYSNLLTSVMHDEYYKSLVHNTKMEDFDSPALDPHPYAFLEDAGIDVDKILDGTYDAKTISFVLDDEPNNLYINTKVLIDDSYWHSFLLTYQLNDKEMKDYIAMHGQEGIGDTYYWPAFFMNDKISETKTPTKIQETKYTKETQIGFDDYHVREAKRGYIFTQIGNEPNKYSFILYENKSHSNTAFTSNKVFIALLKSSYIENLGDNLFDIRYPERYSTESKVETSGTFMTTQNCPIWNSKELELELDK